jgi:hypothetical protein
MELQYKISLVVLFISVFSLSYKIAYSQTDEKPCAHPEASRLDFWVGEWNAEWTDGEGKIQYGQNIITKTLGGCVIEENFSTGDKSFIGKSFSVYYSAKQTWQQTWVDNSGGYLDFTGGMDGEKMIFWRKAINKAGKEIMMRMVFYEISGNSFLWNWESSQDDGKTWSLLWKIKYIRKS